MSKLIQKEGDQFLWSVGKCALCGGEPVLRLNLDEDPYDGENDNDVWACTECCERTVGRILTSYDGWRERLAAVAHEAWRGWLRYMLPILKPGLSVVVRESKAQRAIARWERQRDTDYADLPENEKESDREQADEILVALGVKTEPVELEFVGIDRDRIVSSARLTCAVGDHDKIRLWNRGGLAGELCVRRGDGEELLLRLGMERKES
jgi:hypothetical protein